MKKKNIQTFTEEEQKIKNAILNKNVLGYLNKGVLINPSFIDGIFGNVLYSYWFDYKENKIKLGKFHDLDKIKIINTNKEKVFEE